MAESPRVLVVAPNWLGDAVMALPALADIRRAHADGRLIVAARPPVAPLYAMVPGVDATIVTEWRGSLVDRRTLSADVARVDRPGHPVSQLVRVGVGNASRASERTLGICGGLATAAADEGDRPARRFTSSGGVLSAPRS
jgi:hypothetical protein